MWSLLSEFFSELLQFLAHFCACAVFFAELFLQVHNDWRFWSGWAVNAGRTATEAGRKRGRFARFSPLDLRFEGAGAENRNQTLGIRKFWTGIGGGGGLSWRGIRLGLLRLNLRQCLAPQGSKTGLR